MHCRPRAASGRAAVPPAGAAGRTAFRPPPCRACVHSIRTARDNPHVIANLSRIMSPIGRDARPAVAARTISTNPAAPAAPPTSAQGDVRILAPLPARRGDPPRRDIPPPRFAAALAACRRCWWPLRRPAPHPRRCSCPSRPARRLGAAIVHGPPRTAEASSGAPPAGSGCAQRMFGPSIYTSENAEAPAWNLDAHMLTVARIFGPRCLRPSLSRGCTPPSRPGRTGRTP